MGANTKILLQAVQGIMGVVAAQSEASAAAELADSQVKELERQKEEEALNARSKRSDRAREADKQMGEMIAAMADGGGAGTGNVGRFAGEIGFLEGIDKARIKGNSISRIASLSSRQSQARSRAENAQTRASGSMFSAILSAAGGIATTVAGQQKLAGAIRRQKNTGLTSNVSAASRPKPKKKP